MPPVTFEFAFDPAFPKSKKETVVITDYRKIVNLAVLCVGADF
jgi:hypothetical protein